MWGMWRTFDTFLASIFLGRGLMMMFRLGLHWHRPLEAAHSRLGQRLMDITMMTTITLTMRYLDGVDPVTPRDLSVATCTPHFSC